MKPLWYIHFNALNLVVLLASLFLHYLFGSKTIEKVSSLQIKEFHHKPALAPLQAPLPHQQPLAAHAAAAVAAATSGASKALTPASIALAIKRSTIDLVIKTGAAVADTVAVAGAAAVGTFAAQGLGSPDTMPAGLPRQTKYFEDSSRHQVDFIQSQGKYYNLGEGSVNIDDKEQNKISAGLISASTPEPPKTRLALNRPEVALCLLSEIVCEKDEEFRTHLSQLLHVAVLHIDSINPTVRLEAFQILQYLLYSLSYKQLENDYLGHSPAHNVNQQGFGHQGNQSNDFSADFARVSGVIEYLQSMSGEALWKWELPTLTQPWIKSAGYVAAFVQIGKLLFIGLSFSISGTFVSTLIRLLIKTIRPFVIYFQWQIAFPLTHLSVRNGQMRPSNGPAALHHGMEHHAPIRFFAPLDLH